MFRVWEISKDDMVGLHLKSWWDLWGLPWNQLHVGHWDPLLVLHQVLQGLGVIPWLIRSLDSNLNIKLFLCCDIFQSVLIFFSMSWTSLKWVPQPTCFSSQTGTCVFNKNLLLNHNLFSLCDLGRCVISSTDFSFVSICVTTVWLSFSHYYWQYILIFLTQKSQFLMALL